MKRSPSEPPLSLTRAKEILNAYGAEPKRWPEDERGDLLQLLAQSPELQALRKTASQLDDLLDEWQPEVTRQTAILVGSLPAQTQPKQRWADQLAAVFVPGLPGWRQAALAAAPLTLGFIWGLSGEPHSDDWSEAEFLIFNSPMEVLTDE
jgi:hypothetical protein